jgi:hypothetical protein
MPPAQSASRGRSRDGGGPGCRPLPCLAYRRLPLALALGKPPNRVPDPLGEDPAKRTRAQTGLAGTGGWKVRSVPASRPQARRCGLRSPSSAHLLAQAGTQDTTAVVSARTLTVTKSDQLAGQSSCASAQIADTLAREVSPIGSGTYAYRLSSSGSVPVSAWTAAQLTCPLRDLELTTYAGISRARC